ncbi:MAG: hypothetical protein V4726_20415 [Verrucomicrobiota bacterium]
MVGFDLKVEDLPGTGVFGDGGDPDRSAAAAQFFTFMEFIGRGSVLPVFGEEAVGGGGPQGGIDSLEADFPQESVQVGHGDPVSCCRLAGAMTLFRPALQDQFLVGSGKRVQAR